MIRNLFLIIVMIVISHHSFSDKRLIKVIVIDTGIDKKIKHLCPTGHRAIAGTSALVDNHGHGTHIAGLINRYSGTAEYCIVSVKYYRDNVSGSQKQRDFEEALAYAVRVKPDIINISGGGPGESPTEKALIKKALDKGIKIVTAAGNEYTDLDKDCNYFPACYKDKRLIVVGNLTSLSEITYFHKVMNFLTDFTHKEPYREKKIINPSSNFGSVVTQWEIGTNVLSDSIYGKQVEMTGTSQATAIATGKLIRAMSQN